MAAKTPKKVSPAADENTALETGVLDGEMDSDLACVSAIVWVRECGVGVGETVEESVGETMGAALGLGDGDG